MGETDLTKADFQHDVIRLAFSMLDRPFFWLLTLLYQLFFNVASVELFSESIMKFFTRVQVIIGVYMMFQLAVTILRGIIDPDSFVKNQGGAKGLVPRIIISLTMLALIVPVKASGGDSSEFAAQINNQGLLFGTLNSLQYRIIKNNTIGKLVLGVNDGSSNFIESENDEDSEDLETSARIFASSVLKGFYRINLIPKEDRSESDNPDNKPADQINAYRMCKSISEEIINDEPPYGIYNRVDSDPVSIINNINEPCTSNYVAGGGSSSGTKRYVFVHIPVISAITAAIFCVILLSFTIDVAVRMIKLAMLRLIAPIPIISYMDPNGAKDGAFSSWWKTLLSTYLDLFIRLATVYFVIFLIQDIITTGIIVNTLDGPLGAFTYIAVFIGLFAFAKQAPKFFREILGMKGEGGNFLDGIVGAMAIGRAGAGIIGSGMANFRAASEENRAFEEQRKREANAAGVAYKPHTFRNAGRLIASTIAGGAGGAYVGGKALLGKDASAKTVAQAQSQRNAQRAAHSTLIGRVADGVYSTVNGRSLAAKDQAILDANKAASSSIKTFKATAVDEAKKKGDFGFVDPNKDRTGKLSGKGFNYRNLEAAMQSKDSNGNFQYTYEVLDANGHRTGTTAQGTFNVSMFDTNTMAAIEDTQTAAYLASEFNGSGFNNGKINTDWRTARHDMSEAGINYSGSYLGQTDYGEIGASIGVANSNVADMSTDMKHIMHRANNQSNK